MIKRNKNRGFCAILILCLALVLLLAGCTGANSGDTQPATFSCSTVDQTGTEFKGYYREDIWYLFIPSGVDLSQLQLRYDCSVAVKNVSTGTLDAQNSVVISAFQQSGDSLLLRLQNGQTVEVKVLQSDLPSVQIQLNDTSLEAIHADKDQKHKDNTFVLSDPAGGDTLLVENSVEIKGRGNTTWRMYDKKPYQIKFDEEISLLGMPKSKKWILLAGASDDSLLRSQLAYQLAANLGFAFVTDFAYVDLWIDGEYLGTYLLGEKVELGSGRLALDSDEGALFEHDESFYLGEDYWLYNWDTLRHFVLKEIENEEPDSVNSAMARFDASLGELMNYLSSTPSQQVTLETLGELIDVDSAAKYYLVNEYLLNCESFATSFYLWQDGEGDVLHFGPVWDFDTCMGNAGAAPGDSYGHQHVLFRYLIAAPAFRSYVQQVYEDNRQYFDSLAEDAAALALQIGTSAEMNYLRWNVLGKPSPKNPDQVYAETYEDAVKNLCQWLSARSEQFTFVECRVPAVRQTGERKLIIELEAQPGETELWFKIWNHHGGGRLYTQQAELVNGIWRAEISLDESAESGLYLVDAVPKPDGPACASGQLFVSQLSPSVLQVQYNQYDHVLQIHLFLEQPQPPEEVRFAVWSETGDQQDLQWFTAQEQMGTWSFEVDPKLYPANSALVVHAYGVTGDESEFLNGCVFRPVPAPTVQE